MFGLTAPVCLSIALASSFGPSLSFKNVPLAKGYFGSVFVYQVTCSSTIGSRHAPEPLSAACTRAHAHRLRAHPSGPQHTPGTLGSALRAPAHTRHTGVWGLLRGERRRPGANSHRAVGGGSWALTSGDPARGLCWSSGPAWGSWLGELLPAPAPAANFFRRRVSRRLDPLCACGAAQKGLPAPRGAVP